MGNIKGILFDMGDTLVREYHKDEKIPDKPVVFQDVIAVLDRLSQRYRLAVISNTVTATSNRLLEILKEANMDKYFDFIIASAEEGVDKPEEEIFRKALSKWGFKAEEVIMVGNRISSDILGGNLSGMRSILIWHKEYDHHPDDKEPKNEKEKPIKTVYSFKELEEVIYSLDK